MIRIMKKKDVRVGRDTGKRLIRDRKKATRKSQRGKDAGKTMDRRRISQGANNEESKSERKFKKNGTGGKKADDKGRGRKKEG